MTKEKLAVRLANGIVTDFVEAETRLWVNKLTRDVSGCDPITLDEELHDLDKADSWVQFVSKGHKTVTINGGKVVLLDKK